MPKEPDPSPAAPPPLEELAAEKSGALHPADTVKTAGEKMRDIDTETWPVTEDHKLVGMVGEKNPDWDLGGHGHDPESWRVSSIMSRELVFCFEDEDCAVAAQKMKDQGLAYLPVVDRQMRIVGIFSRQEVVEKANAPATDEAGTLPKMSDPS